MKMKNLVAGCVTAAVSALSALTVRADADGDITRIFPCDERGREIEETPVASVDNPLQGGDTARFVLRLSKRTLADNPWRLRYRGVAGSSVQALNLQLHPYKIGIFVSGRLCYAELEDFYSPGEGNNTDFLFRYEVKSGDFALPIVLAVGQGNPQPADASDESTFAENAYHINEVSLSNWTIDNSTDEAGATATGTAELRFRAVLPETETPDYDLRRAGFNVKTVGFDDNWETVGSVWRSVHEGGTAVDNGTPTLQVVGSPTNVATFYVWSENESAVRISDVGQPASVKVSQREIHTNKTSTAKRWVAEIKVVSGKESYPFAIWGLQQGGTDVLVMSAKSDFTYYAGSSDRNDDYVTVPVRCLEPQPPSVTVKALTPKVEVGPNYAEPIGELQVTVSEANFTPETCTVTITPELTDGATPWSDYVRVSATRDIGTEWSSKEPATVTFKRGEPGTKTVYVYAIGADEHTATAGHEIRFTPTVDEACASYFATHLTPTLMYFIPTDPVMTAVRPSVEAVSGDPKTFELKVTDCLKNTSDTEKGYALYTKLNEGEWQKMDGAWVLDSQGLLKKKGETGTVRPSYVFSAGEQNISFYVEAPNATTSEGAPVTVHVSVSKKSEIWAEVSADDQATWVKNGRYNEGQEFWVRFRLDKPNTQSYDIYAYLVPVGDATNYVSGASLTNETYTEGFKIAPDDDGSEAVPVYGLKLTDGNTAGKSLQFEVVLCKTSQYSADPADQVAGYKSKTLQIVSRNVIPTFKAVYMDNIATKVEASEETMHTGKGKTEKIAYVPLGTEKTFSFNIDEPSIVDLEATGTDEKGARRDFTIQWAIVEENGITDGGTLYGNPANTNFTHKFLSDGTATVTLQMKDKDMNAVGEEFVFYVEVSVQPTVKIAMPKTIDETAAGDSEATKIALTLSDGYAQTLTARVSVVAMNTDETSPAKLGSLKIGGALNATPEIDPETQEEYYLVLLTGTANLYVSSCDGTSISGLTGFKINASIVDDRENPASKTKWNEYYLPANDVMYVKNAAPVLLDCSLGDSVAAGNTNATPVGIGEVITVTYRVSDVKADLEYAGEAPVRSGVTVQWWDTDNKNGPVTNATSSATELTFTTHFTSPGQKTIRVTLMDKDNSPVGQEEWKFLVESTKTLVTIAHGPSSGIGNSAISQRYNGKGIGQGHVWANAAFSSADSFQISWNCNPNQMSATVFGYGYKTNAVDNGWLDSETQYAHDVPLSPKGNNTKPSAKEALDDCYKYTGTVDSFLYGWIYHTIGDDGKMASTFQGLSPERALSGAASAFAPLPAKKDDGEAKSASSMTTAYPVTYMEAIFALELLASDNMGDINQDGIPDAYLLLNDYQFGIVDPKTGELTGNDLRDLNYTEDETPTPFCLDYLPITGMTAYSTLIPGAEIPDNILNSQAFTPRLKIRGFDETDEESIALRRREGVAAGPYGNRISALNDAPEIVGVRDVKPDRVYDNPRTNAYSTLSYVEWLAWSEFKAGYEAEHGKGTATVDLWSPERPTDPTKSDTDNDGITDGYEYYFWYRAHVGWLEVKNGHTNHLYQTGRRYNPHNPGEGDFISPQEVEKIFDPLTPFEDVTRDSDNDGLPDLIEFELGTNPIDFDTDGDGLPDGWELMIAGLNPLTHQTGVDGPVDTLRNYDGDAMAIASRRAEPIIGGESLVTFALIDPSGDTDGVQWYATRGWDFEEGVVVQTNRKSVWTFDVGDFTLISTNRPVLTADGFLARPMTKDLYRSIQVVEILTNAIDETTGEPTATVTNEYWMRTWPVRLEAGTRIDPTTISTQRLDQLAMVITNIFNGANSAWVYGRGAVDARQGDVADSIASYGCLAIGRSKGIAKDSYFAALPSIGRDVAFLHGNCYQEFGFDPRTAWNPTMTPELFELAEKGTVASNDTAAAGTVASRWTRAYCTYDEFLVSSYFLNNGAAMGGPTTSTGDTLSDVSLFWQLFTTNPQGPNEPASSTFDSETGMKYYIGRNSTNGADTDGDGIPDGWELYTMGSGSPYTSFLSPFVPYTDDPSGCDGDNDGLSQYQEFEGTDSIAYYSEANGKALPYSTTIVHDGEWKWLNKRWPTDPGNADTDDDLIPDGMEKTLFAYGNPVDNGGVVPGGGLNPLSMDTDGDGLPDPWEMKFAGSTLYTGKDPNATNDVAQATDTAAGNTPYGYIDGMDGTVWDANSRPEDPVNRDYDRDGLENWQEYLTGLMRCWRYDDPTTTGKMKSNQVPDFDELTGIPEEWYWAIDSETGVRRWAPNYSKLGIPESHPDQFGEFWYKTMIQKDSGIYNPMLVSGGMTLGHYLTCVRNKWDPCYSASGTWLWFYDRLNDEKISEAWIFPKGPWLPKEDFNHEPSDYACCSPIDADSDHDGMDDYYELFHGMNPLLGRKDGTDRSGTGPRDLIAEVWRNGEGKGIRGWAEADEYCANYWQELELKRTGHAVYSFVKYPWLSGIADADPDGDGIPNQEEALMPKISKLASHTDPTPLWMTDSSYPNSMVRRDYRLPARFDVVQPGIGTDFNSGVFVYQNQTNYFANCPGWVGNGHTGYFGTPGFDKWGVSLGKKFNWAFSFEENEGYDSDHDGRNDYEELGGLLGSRSEPQKASDPVRRQAMYFQGPEKPSILQTPATVAEQYPFYNEDLNGELCFAQFTAECWVRPESLEDSIILERAVWTSVSNPKNEEYMRKNFQLGIQNGGDGARWCAKFDPVGTLAKEVRVVSDIAARTEWTHLAVTYDGVTLKLYVNGQSNAQVDSGIPASWGASVIAVTGTQSYWFDLKHELSAIIVGAGAKTQKEGAPDGLVLDLSQGVGFSGYTGFFKGWIDEIRIWDGARTKEEIEQNVAVRLTDEMAAQNRDAVYDAWSQGLRRYQEDGTGRDVSVPAELRYHWSFDGVLGADNEHALARMPHGFDSGRPAASRPSDYRINWWANVFEAYTGSLSSKVWVPWIQNTVAHLPRFDLTTLDSVYWSEDFQGGQASINTFVREGEPLSHWSQLIYNANQAAYSGYLSSPSRLLLVQEPENAEKDLASKYRFAIRHAKTMGADLLPLGGAYARFCDNTVGLWDQEGASSNHEITGADTDADGLPDWWEKYADENYRGALDPSVKIDWNTLVTYHGRLMTAGEAYLRDLANGWFLDAYGEIDTDGKYRQTADVDKDGIPDWWEEMTGLHTVGTDLSVGHRWDDPDFDGLGNYAEYQMSTQNLMGVDLELDPKNAFTQSTLYDYFRTNGLAGAARRYVGFVATDHDFIEDSFETEPERKVFSTHLDPEGNGWSKWSEARAKASGRPETTTYTWTDTNGVEQTSVITNDAGYAGHPTPKVNVTLWGDLETKYHQVAEIQNAGTTNETTNVSMRVTAMYVEAYRGYDFSEAYWYGYIDGTVENGKLTATLDGEGLEEGLNTFVVRNGDTTGFATANVGYDRVDLAIGLDASGSVVPAGIYGYDERLVIRRVAINGYACEVRPVWMGRVDGDVTAAQILVNFQNGVFDLDAKYLTKDAAAMGLNPAAIQSATYEIVETWSYGGGETYTYAYETFEKKFSLARPKATLVSPTANADNRVRTHRPTFTFEGLDGCTAFILEVATNADDRAVVLAVTNLLPATWTTAGRSVRAFASDFQIGDGLDLADGTNYFWRVCGLNAKWPTAGDWSAWGAFATAVDSSNGATGYGKIAAEVRYYGAATNDTSDVIVGVYTDAAFAGKPVAWTHLKKGEFGPLAVTAKEGSAFFKAEAQVTFDGLELGDYYLMAFNDRNGNGVRDPWESWGYLNKVGQEVEDRFTPVPLTVTLTDTATGLVFMEDTDVNDNGVPDCIEEEPEANVDDAGDVDGDGLDTKDERYNEYLWGADPEQGDTDGDGLPDGYEVWAGLDPFDAWDAQTTYTYTDTNGVAQTFAYRTSAAEMTVPGDVMAYARVTRKVITFRNAVDGTSYRVVVDKDDTTPYAEGGTLTAGRRYRGVMFYATLPADEWNDYAYDVPYYCLGGFYDATANDVVVKIENDFPIMLLHWQVYQEFGFESGVATPNGTVHTRPMYGIDKYLVARLFGTDCENWMNRNRKWGQNLTALKPGVADFDGDGINDGWELYVMFPGLTDVLPGISPWINSDGYTITEAGREWAGFTWTDAQSVEHTYSDCAYDVGKMYNGGVNPSNPYDQNSLLPGTGIDDKTARKYNLETAANQLADNDNDGLSNWAEYLAACDAEVPQAANLDVNKSFSDGAVLDFFRTNAHAGVDRRYLGELVTDHDFIEDTWEDIYDKLVDGLTDVKFATRYVYDAHRDYDEDGWSVWSEARAGTDPTTESILSLVSPANNEDNILGQYPVPVLKTTVTYASDEAFKAPIVIRAWKSKTLAGAPDARWTATGSETASQEHTRFLGLNPNRKLMFNIGPGSISRESIEIGIFDPNYQVQTINYNTNGTVKSEVWGLAHTARNSKWAGYVYTDKPISATSKIGTFLRRIEGAEEQDGETVAKSGSWVNYETGDICIDASEIQDPDATLRVSHSDTQDVYEHYDETRSYLRVKWFSRIVTAGNTKTLYLSVPDESTAKAPHKGHLREGLNTFVAFADTNGDGQWQPGEPYGVARDVEIGHDRAEVNITLDGGTTELPRFTVTPTNAYQTVRIVRETVNGEAVKPVCVWARTLDFANRTEVTEADYLSTGTWDLDAAYLISDRAAQGLAASDIKKVGYAVYFGFGDTTPIATFERTFEPFAAPVASAHWTEGTSTLRAARPTFSWKSENKCPSFILAVTTADDADFANPVFVTTNFYQASSVDGFGFSPEIYVGNELLDGTNYLWRVADFNAVTTNLVWSDKSAFRTAVDSTNADTGYGKLAAEIRYYGPATNTFAETIVEVYDNAGFAGAPVARKVLGAAEKKVAELAVTPDPFMGVTTNVVFDGLAPGSYYVMAFVDANTNGVRDAYETWGYYNNVGTGSAALYTPMTLTVKATKGEIESGIVFMEDTDVNDNKIPDCLEDVVWPDPGAAVDSDGDGIADEDELNEYGTDPGLFDTDGDGIPDGAEIWSGTDPLMPDADQALEGDAMAYAAVPVWFAWVGPDAGHITRYAIMDLNGEGVKLRDSDIPLQTEAVELRSLVTTFAYGDEIGIGTNVTFAAGEKVWKTECGEVALVHAQVYAQYGYEVGCAVTEHPHTKAFTALDKYLVCRYLENIGVEGFSEKEANEKRLWSQQMLKATEIDSDRDDIADGWELYTMFGVTDLKAFTGTTLGRRVDLKISPFDTADGMRVAPGADSQLKLVEEFDGGYLPTDPWSVDTDKDGIADRFAYQYRLKGEQYREDLDNDGLSNFQEFLAAEGFKGLAFPKIEADRMMTAGKAFGGGQLVPDYFLRVGSLYVGEILTDHDFIEDWLEDSDELFTSPRSASRYVYDAQADADGNGWDNWSEARAFLASPVTNVTEIVTNETKIVTNTFTRSLYAGHPEPTGRIKIAYNGKQNFTGSPIVVKAYRYRDGKMPDMSYPADVVWNLTASDTLGVYELSNVTNGYIRGGSNLFVVWAETKVVDGVWTPGEPYGIVPEVAVGYSRISDSEVTLTDVNASMMRIDLQAATANNTFDGQKTVNDRGVNMEGVFSNEASSSNALTVAVASSGKIRVRVVRMNINGNVTSWKEAKSPYKVHYVASPLIEKEIDLEKRPFLTEADLMQEGLFDLDWGSIKNSYEQWNVKFDALFKIGYAILIGDEEFKPASIENAHFLATMFYNGFEAGSAQTKAVPKGIVSDKDVCPTFTWEHHAMINGTSNDMPFEKSYPAFRLRVWDGSTGSTPVYDSKVRRAPMRDANGRYAWQAPDLFVGVPNAGTNVVLKNDKKYTYTVSMLDAKFTEVNSGETPCSFTMKANGIGGALSDQYSIYAAVKYFGPVETNKTIRVEAFETPDFVGTPVSAAHVLNTVNLMTTNTLTCNAQIIGLEAGKAYYIRAFIDSNGNGIRDVTESWGYGNYVGSDRKDLYTPRAYEVATGSFQMPEAVIYIEDVDHDNDGIPDARTDLTAPSADSPYIVTYAGGTAKPVATNLFSALDKDAALLPFVSQLHTFDNDRTISSFQLYYAMAQGDVPSVDQLKTESDIRVTSFSLEEGIRLAISTRTTVDGKTLLPKVSGLNYSVKLQVKVWHVDELEGSWTEVDGSPLTVTVPVNAVDETVDPTTLKKINEQILDLTPAESGFFKVTAEIAP